MARGDLVPRKFPAGSIDTKVERLTMFLLRNAESTLHVDRVKRLSNIGVAGDIRA